MNRATIQELCEAVLATPLDADLRRIYADRLEEEGKIAWANHQRWLADRAGQPVSRLDDLLHKLARCNGRRRPPRRPLRWADVERCIQVARARGTWHAIGFGNVHRLTVCLAAVRSDGRIRVALGVTSGNPKSSLVNAVSGLTESASDQDIREWADRQLCPYLIDQLMHS